MDRDSFLQRIRSCLETSGPSEALPERESYRSPAASSREDKIQTMLREHEAVGGLAYRVGSPAEAREQVVEIVVATGAARVIRGATPLIQWLDLDPELTRAGIAVTVADLSLEPLRDHLREQAFAADVGITSVDFGVAETGTLALLAGPGQGRAVSLLPPVHVAVLDARDLVDELAELFEETTAQGALPSALTFVTGPSRTGDIEQKLTIGIHGPKELHLVVVNAPDGLNQRLDTTRNP